MNYSKCGATRSLNAINKITLRITSILFKGQGPSSSLTRSCPAPHSHLLALPDLGHCTGRLFPPSGALWPLVSHSLSWLRHRFLWQVSSDPPLWCTHRLFTEYLMFPLSAHSPPTPICKQPEYGHRVLGLISWDSSGTDTGAGTKQTLKKSH